MYSYCIKNKSQNFSLDILLPIFQKDDILLNPKEIQKISASKNQINNYRYNKQWERIKKISNPYELVYVNDKMLSQKSVANIEPISRSFFKMLEITYNFFPEIIISSKKYETYELPSSIKPIKTLHLCESPGGFIASMRYSRNYHPNDELFTISLRPINKNIPSWNKSQEFFTANPQIKILYGVDNTGDIYNPSNILELTKDLGGYHTCDIITGDGGFDFSVEFNNQEANMSKLIFSQILAALINQKSGGSFVLKIFDINCLITYNLIYILQCYYQEIFIYKPCISRIANSEKYLVCKNYTPINIINWTNLVSLLYALNKFPNNNVEHSIDNSMNIHLVSLFPENTRASSLIKEANSKIINQQIKNIDDTIALIQNPPNKDWFILNSKNQIEQALEWCRKYNIPTI
jgi:23S rRNA U2552 (ribose-2'-O)-methylase RlmE/FtsJ